MHQKILETDCLRIGYFLPYGSADLIITSPPYADRRKTTYGGPATEAYLEFFLPRAEQFQLVLKETGSFILNIKEHCEDGERSDYVMRLVLALRENGWRLVDEFIWNKSNPMPGHWNGRLKDGWEHLYHFTKEKRFKFFPDAVRRPASAAMIEKFKKGGTGLNEPDVRSGTGSGHDIASVNMVRRAKRKELSATGSGFTKDREAEKTWTTARPSNVLRCSAETTNKGHPAVFPLAIPEFFIKLLTDEGDLVVDPFCGSGTALEAASLLGRDWVGFDTEAKYCEAARDRVRAKLV